MNGVLNANNLFSLLGMLSVIIFALIIALTIFKRTDKKRMLKVGAFILIILELIKIGYIFYTYGTLDKGYLPFDFSGIILIAISIVAFNRGRLSNYLKPFAYAFGLIISLASLILLPNTAAILSTDWSNINNFLPMWNYIFYGMILTFVLYLRLSLEYIPKKKDIIKAIITTIIFICLVQLINLGLNTDFMGLNLGTGNLFKSILETNGFWPYLGVQTGIVLILYFIIFMFL